MADRVGQEFGAYQLTSLLAENTIDEVYHGEQRYSHIDVAIKLLRRPVATTEEIDAFRSQARALGELVNPHIVRVLSFDVQSQVGYVVMDFVPGGTLRQRHPSGSVVPLETILPYAAQIAEALDYAHSQGVIHRALRPEHLLVRQQDELVLAGFYLASAYPPADAQSPTPIAVTAYLAPEQLQQRAFPASDQYALGVIVYEWLSGALPFQGSGAELAEHILKAAPAPLHGGTLVISPQVERVVMRALAKDPAKRFPSVQAFAAALEEAAQAAPAPQPTAASDAAAKQPAAAGRAAQAGRAPTPQAANYPQAGQAYLRTPAAPQQASMPQPAPQQGWQRQPVPYQAAARPPARQRQVAQRQATNWNMIGCVSLLVVVALIGLIALLANAGH